MVQATRTGANIFVAENGEPLEIWLDPYLSAHSELFDLVRSHGGQISDRHDDPAVQLLILHPTSLDVFDRYCHPSWLPMSGKHRYQRLLNAGGVDESKHKVLLTESWIRLCILTNRLLGGEVDWEGCRKGGLKLIKQAIRILALPQEPVAVPPAQRQPSPSHQPSIEREESPHDAEQSDGEMPASAGAQDTNSSGLSGRRRSTLRSVVLQPGDPALNPQTSRWQVNGPHPPRILQGQRIHVDASGRYGRKQTLRNITSAGGKIATDIMKATHALLSTVNPSEEEERLELVKQCAAHKVWCVGYDWLEDSFDAGKILPPSRYAYEGGYIRTRLSDEALNDIFAAAKAAGVTRAEVGEKLLAEHGVYSSANSWRQMYRQWLDRSGRFAHRPREASSNGSVPPSDLGRQARNPSTQAEDTLPDDLPSRPRAGSHLESGPSTTRAPASQSTTTSGTSKSHGHTLTEERLRILRNAYPLCMTPGGQYIDVARYLTRQYPEHSEGSWTRMFYTWRKLPDPQDYSNYRSVFRSYLPSVVNGLSVEEVSQRLTKDHRDFGHTASEWHRLFGNWLRKGETVDQPGLSATTPRISPARAPAPTPAAPTTSRPTFGKMELARWFREEFNSPTWVAREVAQATQSILKSLEEFYNQWRMNAEKFKDLPAACRYTGTGTEEANTEEPDSSPATPAPSGNAGPSKRKAKDQPSRAPAAKKGKSDFTEDEEARMAVYIAFRTPTVTEPLFGDWVDFAKDNKNRPVPDWVEHYRSYRARINDLVIKLGATVPGRRSNGTKRRTARASSSDSVEFVAVQEKTTRMEDVEIVDVEDSSDEDA